MPPLSTSWRSAAWQRRSRLRRNGPYRAAPGSRRAAHHRRSLALPRLYRPILGLPSAGEGRDEPWVEEGASILTSPDSRFRLSAATRTVRARAACGTTRSKRTGSSGRLARCAVTAAPLRSGASVAARADVGCGAPAPAASREASRRRSGRRLGDPAAGDPRERRSRASSDGPRGARRHRGRRAGFHPRRVRREAPGRGCSPEECPVAMELACGDRADEVELVVDFEHDSVRDAEVFEDEVLPCTLVAGGLPSEPDRGGNRLWTALSGGCADGCGEHE